MRLSGLSLAAILLISSAVWAQHSSGGGGGSSAGGASAGGSHGGGGGSSFSGGSSGGHGSGGSGAGHSSGGTVSHGSGSRGTSAGGTNSIVTGREAAPNHLLHGLNLAAELRPAPPEKRGFFSLLRHPFHRPERKAPVEANIVLPACVRGQCRPCPAGARNCSAPVIPLQRRRGCWSRGVWNGTCQWQTRLLDDCGGLRFALNQQLHRMQAAESTMQNSCSGGATPGCSETSAAWNSQAGLYRALEARYRSCLAGTANVYPFGGHMIVGQGGGLLFEPLSLDWTH